MDEQHLRLKNEIEYLLGKAKESRRRQNDFFRNKNDVNLKYAKAAEAELDHAIRTLESRGYKPAPPSVKPTQQTLI